MQKPVILIVDDEPDIVGEMVTMLALVDVPAADAGCVQDALRALRDQPSIRCVICDVHLQHDDGRNLLALLQDEPALASRSLHVIFITGDSDVQDIPAQKPPVTVLSKPIDPDLLIECVHHCLGMQAR